MTGRRPGRGRSGGDGRPGRDGRAGRTRRSLLATLAGGAGAASLAGCLGLGGASPTEAADPWLSRETVADGDGVSGRLRLRRGEYFAYRFDLAEPGNLHLRARERLSLPIDLVTVAAGGRELRAYRAGEPVDPINTYSLLGVTQGRFDRRIPDGSYVFLVDNTRLGEAPPFDEIDVGLEVRIER